MAHLSDLGLRSTRTGPRRRFEAHLPARGRSVVGHRRVERLTDRVGCPRAVCGSRWWYPGRDGEGPKDLGDVVWPQRRCPAAWLRKPASSVALHGWTSGQEGFGSLMLAAGFDVSLCVCTACRARSAAQRECDARSPAHDRCRAGRRGSARRGYSCVSRRWVAGSAQPWAPLCEQRGARHDLRRRPGVRGCRGSRPRSPAGPQSCCPGPQRWWSGQSRAGRRQLLRSAT